MWVVTRHSVILESSVGEDGQDLTVLHDAQCDDSVGKRVIPGDGKELVIRDEEESVIEKWTVTPD